MNSCDSHDIYIAANVQIDQDRPEYKAIKRRLYDEFRTNRIYVSNWHKSFHATLAYAKEVPVIKQLGIIKDLRASIEENGGVEFTFDSIQLMGDNKSVALVASQPDTKKVEIYKNVLRKHGCRIEHDDHFCAHVTIIDLRQGRFNRQILDRVLKDVSETMLKDHPMTLKSTSIELIDRDDGHRKLISILL